MVLLYIFLKLVVLGLLRLAFLQQDLLRLKALLEVFGKLLPLFLQGADGLFFGDQILLDEGLSLRRLLFVEMLQLLIFSFQHLDFMLQGFHSRSKRLRVH